MCILFIYNGFYDVNSDYRIILVENRDEFLDRPSQPMDSWKENSNIFGGRDLQPGSVGGAWLAINSVYKKIGVLLNLPSKKENTQSRGKITVDFVQLQCNTTEYIEYLRGCANEYNDYTFVTVEYGASTPTINSYTNVTDKIEKWSETVVGFGNSLPNCPLKKVETGREKFKNICQKYDKVIDKSNLIEDLIKLLKNTDSNLPDPQLEKRRPDVYKELSSIFVNIPKARYGTRAHTIVLVTKSGQVDLIEISMKSPIDVYNPCWERKEYNFGI